jgi:hypothetical protein
MPQAISVQDGRRGRISPDGNHLAALSMVEYIL